MDSLEVEDTAAVWRFVSQAVSVLLSSLGLLLIVWGLYDDTAPEKDQTDPSEDLDSPRTKDLHRPLLGAALCLAAAGFAGLAVFIDPFPHVHSVSLGCIEFALPGLPPLLCWLVLQYLLVDESLPPNQGSSAFLCWLGTGLVAKFCPRPDSLNFTSGLEGLSRGRNDGSRGPFIVYLVCWCLTCLFFLGTFRGPRRSSKAGPFRRVAPVVLCVLMSSLASLGAEIAAISLYGAKSWDTMIVCFLGAAAGLMLTCFAIACAWDALLHMDMPLGVFLPAAAAGNAMLCVLQDHFFYHDVSWAGEGSDENSHLTTFGLGCALTGSVIALLLKDLTSTSDMPEYQHHIPAGWSRSTATARHWIALAICALCYYQGVTQPLVQVKRTQYLSEHRHPKDLTKSNLELIGYLYNKRMPCAALVVALCSLIIPAIKFAGTFCVMCPPRALSDKALRRLRIWLGILSPYQFSDILLALLLLAYLNLDAANGNAAASMVHCIVRGGFVWFLVYCLGSVALAQTLESDGDAEELAGAPAAKGDPSTLRQWPSNENTEQNTRTFSILGGKVEAGAMHPSNGIQLDNNYGHQFALFDDQAEILAEIARHNLVICLCCFVIWLGCTIVLLFQGAPLLSVESRVAGVIVRIQDPPLWALYYSLAVSSGLLVAIAIVPVIVTPVIYLVLCLFRSSLIQNKSLDTIELQGTLYSWEQMIKPWVMSDVFAVAVSAFYLSVQEPSSPFIEICAILPSPCTGFMACIGMGVASYTMRNYAPPPPAYYSEGSQTPRLNHVPLQGWIPGQEAYEPDPEDDESQVTIIHPESKWSLSKYPISAPFLWLLWWLTLWQFGPKNPPEVHNLSDLNRVLAHSLPFANKLLHLHVPITVGNCPEFAEHVHSDPTWQQGGPLQPHAIEECKGEDPMAKMTVKIPFGVGMQDVDLEVKWATGVSTFTINQIVVVPRDSSYGFRWGIRMDGMFTDLKVWLKAQMLHLTVIDGYTCCKSPYHFSIEISAICTQERAFYGTAKVDYFKMDPIEIEESISMPFRQGEQASIILDVGNGTEAVRNAISSQIQSLLTGNPQVLVGKKPEKPQPTKEPPKPKWNITDMLNHIVAYNGGAKCPEPPPPTLPPYQVPPSLPR